MCTEYGHLVRRVRAFPQDTPVPRPRNRMLIHLFPPRRSYEASKDLLDQYLEDKVDVDDEILEEE